MEGWPPPGSGVKPLLDRGAFWPPGAYNSPRSGLEEVNVSQAEQQTIRLGYFSASVVTALARRGPFASHGLAVSAEAVPSSTEQFRRLRSGAYDLVLTSPDNVLNYRVNRSNPLGELMDVRILAGVDLGLGLSLMSSGQFKTIAGLRGKRIGVDVPSSGFAGALFDILAGASLRAGDYEVLSLGSTPGRAAALLAGECEATLLNAGHDVIAEHAGARRLARVSAALGRYPGSVLAARADVLADRPAMLNRFVNAWAEARRTALDPRQRKFVEAELARGLAIPAPVAAEAYRTLVDPAEGLIADGRFTAEDWTLLVDLRARADRFDADVNVMRVRADPPVTTGADWVEHARCGPPRC